MKDILANLTGALALSDRTFTDLRENSSVLLRGFLLLLAVGLLVGIFQVSVSLAEGPGNTAQEGIPPAFRAMIPPDYQTMAEDSAREGAAIGADIQKLAPQAGEAFRPAANALRWIGQVLSVPLSMSFLGWMLLAGLVVHITSHWLGGRANVAQMLGLSALAFAPRVFDPIAILLNAGGGTLATIGGLVSLIVFIWGIAIYIKATAVAQNFSLGRALGAILLAFVVATVATFLLGLFAGALLALMGSALAGAR